MAFAYLILAHLVADFLLQPNSLLRWKYHTWKGVAAHAFIHFLAYLLLFWPYRMQMEVIAIVAGIALSHFWIDVFKIREEKGKKHCFRYFTIDQIIHISILAVGGYFLSTMIERFYGNMYFFGGLIIFVSSTYALEIAKFQWERRDCSTGTFKADYKGMALRGLGAMATYSLVVLLLLR